MGAVVKQLGGRSKKEQKPEGGRASQKGKRKEKARLEETRMQASVTGSRGWTEDTKMHRRAADSLGRDTRIGFSLQRPWQSGFPVKRRPNNVMLNEVLGFRF